VKLPRRDEVDALAKRVSALSSRVDAIRARKHGK
jgi:hypothetical protein